MTLPSYEKSTVCVTGGCGFIGSHLVHGLIGVGSRVRVVDDLSSGDPENLAELRSDVTLLEGSIQGRSTSESLRRRVAPCSRAA